MGAPLATEGIFFSGLVCHVGDGIALQVAKPSQQLPCAQQEPET